MNPTFNKISIHSSRTIPIKHTKSTKNRYFPIYCSSKQIVTILLGVLLVSVVDTTSHTGYNTEKCGSDDSELSLPNPSDPHRSYKGLQSTEYNNSVKTNLLFNTITRKGDVNMLFLYNLIKIILEKTSIIINDENKSNEDAQNLQDFDKNREEYNKYTGFNPRIVSRNHIYKNYIGKYKALYDDNSQTTTDDFVFLFVNLLIDLSTEYNHIQTMPIFKDKLDIIISKILKKVANSELKKEDIVDLNQNLINFCNLGIQSSYGNDYDNYIKQTDKIVKIEKRIRESINKYDDKYQKIELETNECDQNFGQYEPILDIQKVLKYIEFHTNAIKIIEEVDTHQEMEKLIDHKILINKLKSSRENYGVILTQLKPIQIHEQKIENLILQLKKVEERLQNIEQNEVQKLLKVEVHNYLKYIRTLQNQLKPMKQELQQNLQLGQDQSEILQRNMKQVQDLEILLQVPGLQAKCQKKQREEQHHNLKPDEIHHLKLIIRQRTKLRSQQPNQEKHLEEKVARLLLQLLHEQESSISPSNPTEKNFALQNKELLSTQQNFAAIAAEIFKTKNKSMYENYRYLLKFIEMVIRNQKYNDQLKKADYLFTILSFSMEIKEQ